MHVLHEDMSEEGLCYVARPEFREGLCLRHAVPAVNKCESASLCTRSLFRTVLHGMSGLPPITCLQP